MKYNKPIKGIVLGICLVSSAMVFADNVVVSAKMDSTAIWMGEQTMIHLEMAQDKGKVVQMPFLTDSLVTGIEILRVTMPDTTDLGNNRIQIKSDVLITSFDSGFYYIPPFRYILNKDTFTTETLSLKVVPMEVDTTKAGFDIKGVQKPPFVLWDYISNTALVIIGIVLLLVALGLLYWSWWRKREHPEEVISPESLLPPHIKAMNALEEVKESKLWQNGQEKEYYTRVTDILREYIDERFHVNAMEMTSSEIISILRKNEDAKLVNHKLKEILEMADFVKFAKMRPLPEDNEAVMRNAITFVEETKPVEKIPVEEKSDSTAEAQKEDISGEKTGQ